MSNITKEQKSFALRGFFLNDCKADAKFRIIEYYMDTVRSFFSVLFKSSSIIFLLEPLLTLFYERPPRHRALNNIYILLIIC